MLETWKRYNDPTRAVLILAAYLGAGLGCALMRALMTGVMP